MKDILVQALKSFDGKRVECLKPAAQLSPTEEDIEFILTILRESSRNEEAGTWLLKAWAENGYRYSETQVKNWFYVTITLKHWGATLHFCQSLEFLSIPGDLEPELFQSLISNTESKSKLVRAWSYNGLAILANQNPTFMAEAVLHLESGSEDASAAVRARVRAAKGSLRGS